MRRTAAGAFLALDARDDADDAVVLLPRSEVPVGRA
jgi:hypothetical protein